jgi:uncharacterized protein YqgQ|nr:MAG TPA: Gas vesicle protein G [Caudoviricetes sp.]
MSFGWIVVLILGMIYIGMVIPNQQRLKALEMALTTINKAIDAGLITKEEFGESMKEIAKELGAEDKNE